MNEKEAQARIDSLTKKPNGLLEQWDILHLFGGRVAVGFCKEHEARPDLVGRRIRTSEVLVDASDDGYIETRNTIYRLGERAPDQE